LLPQELIVVNDGSSDGTAALIDRYAAAYSWIKAVHNYEDKGYAGGAKIVAAFYRGFEQISQPYDFIAKMDADIEVEPNYFQRIAEIFTQYPKVGLAGGLLLTEKNGQWVYENISDRDHVKGAFKAWRKEAFEDIGGIRPTIGWDSADEILVQYHGWQVKVDEQLPVKHYRPLGTNTGFVKVRVRIGYSLYRMRYGFWISLISSAKVAFRNRPFLLSGLAMVWGYLEAWWRGDKYAVSEEEGRFFRQFRWQRMRQKLK
jgi:glycosyltransferase involved in cell wall biosynthesis